MRFVILAAIAAIASAVPRNPRGDNGHHQGMDHHNDRNWHSRPYGNHWKSWGQWCDPNWDECVDGSSCQWNYNANDFTCQ